MTLEAEIEGPPFGADNALEAAHSEAIEPTAVEALEPAAPGETLPAESTTEQDIPFPKPSRRRK
jgi:hypothetical protein